MSASSSYIVWFNQWFGFLHPAHNDINLDIVYLPVCFHIQYNEISVQQNDGLMAVKICTIYIYIAVRNSDGLGL